MLRTVTLPTWPEKKLLQSLDQLPFMIPPMDCSPLSHLLLLIVPLQLRLIYLITLFHLPPLLLCIQSCKDTWFSRSTDDGVVYQQYFNPIRPQTVALIFTAVRVCLDEFKTGKFTRTDFTQAIYAPIYNELLANLLTLDNIPESHFTEELGLEIWENSIDGFEVSRDDSVQPSLTPAEAEAAVRDQAERYERQQRIQLDGQYGPDADGLLHSWA